MFAALAFLATTLSGCFGIEERVLIHKDGSGVFTYSIDCTKMITELMDMAEKLTKAFTSDSTAAKSKKEKEPEDVKQKMMEKIKDDFVFNKDGRMNGLKGISSYREFADTAGGKVVIGVSFSFDKVASLNKALISMFNRKGKGKEASKGMPPATYTFKNGVLTRELTQSQVQELMGSDDDNEAAKKLLKDFKYVIIVESDGEVKTATAPGATINRTSKRVEMNYEIMDKSKEIVESRMKSEVIVY